MMSIREKLAALQGAPPAPAAPLPPAQPMRGREAIGLVCEPTPQGDRWRRHREFTAAQIPMFPLAEFACLLPEQLALVGKSRALQRARPENLLFIDTETTGLAGGTGTYAFLVGMARCRDGLVEVNQYFLRDPGEERLLYEQVLTEMAAADALVSYNGKSYDLPLIRNRCVLNRLDFGWDDLLHLDLLHTVRRLFKSLPSCALTEVETRVLQFRRESDIPGALIPALYFSAVREGDLTALLPVFQHNVMDLLSLIGITAVAAARFERTGELNSADLLAVVRTLSDLGHFEQAERACAAVATGNGDAEWAAVARHHARMHKQRGDWSAAAQIWRRWIEQATRFDPEPYEELAKYLEHRCGELAQALEIVRRAEKHLALLRELHDSSLYFIWNAQLLHRRERLQRKLASMGAST